MSTFRYTTPGTTTDNIIIIAHITKLSHSDDLKQMTIELTSGTVITLNAPHTGLYNELTSEINEYYNQLLYRDQKQ